MSSKKPKNNLKIDSKEKMKKNNENKDRKSVV